MNFRLLFLAVSISLSLSVNAYGDDGLLRIRALRVARKVARTAPTPGVTVKKNTNFEGVWGGRYYYASGASTCGTSVSSFDFRHLLVNRGSNGILSTNHAGDFNGRSRDKGRRWEFSKGITVGGRPAAIFVLYQNLSRNGDSAVTGIGFALQGGCVISYGANAVRLAR